jgi:hypothetical protein
VSNVSSDEIDAATVTTNHGVEETRPDLFIGRECVCIQTDMEIEVQKARVLLQRDLQQTCLLSQGNHWLPSGSVAAVITNVFQKNNKKN